MSGLTDWDVFSLKIRVAWDLKWILSWIKLGSTSVLFPHRRQMRDWNSSLLYTTVKQNFQGFVSVTKNSSKESKRGRSDVQQVFDPLSSSTVFERSRNRNSFCGKMNFVTLPRTQRWLEVSGTSTLHKDREVSKHTGRTTYHNYNQSRQ